MMETVLLWLRTRRFLHTGAVFLLMAVLSLPFAAAGHDDAWIMLFAGETLGRGPWFLNYNGATQEISTSVLGALLAALPSRLVPVSHEYVAWKFLAWLPAMFAGVSLFTVLRERCGQTAAYCWLFVLCCIPQWHYWAWGGLESGLFCLLSLLFALSLWQWVERPDTGAGWCVGALAFALPLARADALWAPLILLCATALASPSPLCKRLMPGLCALTAVLAFHGLRRWLSGQWLPSPAYAKASLSLEGPQQGLNYLYQFHAQTPLHAVLAISLPLSIWGVCKLLRSACGNNTTRPGLFEWAALLVLIIDASTVLVGGDWMSYHRFASRSLILKILVLALAADMILKWLDTRVRTPYIRHPTLATFMAIALSGWTADGVVEHPGQYISASQISPDVPLSPDLVTYITAANIPLRRDTVVLLPWLNQELPQLVEQARTSHALPLVLASYQAGFFAREVRQRYRVDEVLFVDLAGLTERRIGSLPGPRMAKGLSDGLNDWARAIAYGDSALGHFLADCRPDVVYVLYALPDDFRLMAAAGYSASYVKSVMIADEPRGAVIFTRAPAVRASKCAALATQS